MARTRSSSNNSGPSLASPPFNDSDTALRGSAFFQEEADSQVVSAAKDNFRKDDDVRRQWSEATWTTNGSPKGEHNQAHQFALKRGNAIFTWVQHFIHHLAPHGMAGFVLARFLFWVKSRAAGEFTILDNRMPESLRERRRDHVRCVFFDNQRAAA